MGGEFKEGETFGEKKLRYTQGLVPGISVAVHLEDVFEQALVSPVLYSDGHAYNYSTLDFINVWLCRLALRLISGISRGCSSG